MGDLVARGPDSLRTLAYLHKLGDSFRSVLGNHDLHFLAIYCGYKGAKPADRLQPLLDSPDVSTYINWLRQMPLAAQVDDNTLVSHAGLYPKWSFKKALSLSAEIEHQLQGENWRALLKTMYGSESVRWEKKLEGVHRNRFIINAMTRMRYLTMEKALEFAYKCPPQQAPKGIQPWFDVHNKRLQPGQRIVFGHWAALMGQTGQAHCIGLDTGYVWGNRLTLLNLTDSSYSHVEHI